MLLILMSEKKEFVYKAWVLLKIKDLSYRRSGPGKGCSKYFIHIPFFVTHLTED